ncbi:MAG: SCO family protein [Desulfobacteraceae bacterium]
MGGETVILISNRRRAAFLAVVLMGWFVSMIYPAWAAEPSRSQGAANVHHEQGLNAAADGAAPVSAEASDTDSQVADRLEMVGGHKSAHVHQEKPAMELGVTEKIGQTVPPDIVLIDENQQRQKLGDIVTKPAILVLVYYTCPTVCPTIQANLAYALKDTSRKLSDDFMVISVSFDKADTPRESGYARRNYTSLLGDQNGVDWRFYTADQVDIMRLTDAVGFHFKEMHPRNFVHPNLLTVLSGQRKVIRYLYGAEYLPFDLTMALTEASKNTPGISIKKIVSYCFDYDPKNKRYAFRLFRVIGTVTLMTLGGVMFFLLRKRRET